ncbi:hypothetical protein F2Q69_00039092 [Brassica cretica]|uniref:Uncharacterized protein n=1 Tax=Brassica cretica TaxID=69181 RepID=A0A8S9SST6_BRACR|nr:hypothetical protein F2Q69_00039092 [Brassica cretica]
MNSSATVPFGSPPLPPEPPDPDLVVVFPINPPDPPPVLLVCPFLRQISPSDTDPLKEKEIESLMPWELCSSTGCLLKPLCSYVDVLSTGISPSGALNSGRSYSSFRHYPVSKPIIITSCVEHVLLKSALRASTIYHQESCVVSLSFARLLVSIAECKLTSLQYSSLQSLEDWAWKVEILVVIFSLFAALNTSMQHFEVELSTALCSSQSRRIFSCFKLSLGMVFLISWSESRLFDPCLLVDLSYLSRNPILHRNEKVLLSWISSVPHFEDVTLPLSFRLKLSLPQYEEACLRYGGSPHSSQSLQRDGSPCPPSLIEWSMCGLWTRRQSGDDSQSLSTSNINWTLETSDPSGLNHLLLCHALRVGLE